MKNRLVILGADFSANAILGKVETSYSLNVDVASVDVPRLSPVTIYARSELQTYNDDVLMGSTPAPISVSATGGLIVTVGEPNGNLYPITIDGSAATEESCIVTIVQIGSSNIATVEAICQIYAIKRTTNAPVMDVVYNVGWAASPDYMTFAEAAAVTQWSRKFMNNTEIVSFDEAIYFYNVADTANSILAGCSLLERVDLSTWAEIYVLNALQGYYFYNCTSLSSVKLPKRIRGSLISAFRNTPMLKSIDFSNTEFVDIANCEYAFYQSGIESLDISGRDLTKATSMADMLGDCTQLKTVAGFKNLSTPLCTKADRCFAGSDATHEVTQLESLDISGWTLADGATVNLMFNRNTGLKYLNVGEGWGSNINLSGMFGYQGSTRRLLERVDGWLDFSSTGSVSNFNPYLYYLRKLEIRNIGKVADVTKLPSFNWMSEWGVNSTEVPDAEASFKNTMRYLFDRASAGYSNLTISLSANTKAILNADATLLAEVVAKGYTIA